MNKIVTDPILVIASPAAMREKQRAWAATSLAQRLAVVARARHAIARDAERLAATIPRPQADTLGAEILPLAAAAAFLVRRAPALLRPRRLFGAPLWLFGTRQQVRREPRGVILILAPGNYPLLLPGVQALQALAAGNAVAIKPAPGKSAPMHLFADLLAEAGLPPGLLAILPEAAGPDAVRAGYDYIVLTGGVPTGIAVAREAAETLTPTAMELSGVDAVFVLPGADLALAATALAYGLRLNGGETCIAPRRVFVPKDLESDLLSRLLPLLPPPAPISARTEARLAALLDDAECQGARIVARNPAILAAARPTMALLQEDVFAPWLALVPVPNTDTYTEAALAAAAHCPYALGASIFGPTVDADRLAARIDAGSVCINDLIAPTADPRLPFGGRKLSGYGVTRGAEGLLEMTVIKTVSTRRGRFRPHLDPKTGGNARTLLLMTQLLHGTWEHRWKLLKSLKKGSRPRSPAGRS